MKYETKKRKYYKFMRIPSPPELLYCRISAMI